MKKNKKELTKSAKYFKQRQEYRLKQQLRDAKEVEKDLAEQYNIAKREIQKNINDLFARFAKDNKLTYAEANKWLTQSEYKTWRKGIVDYIKEIEATGDVELLKELNILSMKSRISRLESLYGEVDKELCKLYQHTNETTHSLLKGAVKDNYYQTTFDVQKYFGKATVFGILDNKQVEKVLNYPWSGFNYSDTLWKNKDLLTQTVKREMTQMIIQGLSSDKVSRRIADRMNSDLNNAMRVVNTEHSYICSEGNYLAMEELDVEKYQVIVTYDDVTCLDCQMHDMEVVDMRDREVGTNASPFHRSLQLQMYRSTLYRR